MNMGVCRGLNLALGMAAVPGVLASAWPVALIPAVYVAGVTTLSRGEVSGGRRAVAASALALVGASLAALTVLVGLAGRHRAAALVLAGILAWRVVPPFLAAYGQPGPGPIRLAVRRGVLSLVLLDAALAAAFAGVSYGAAVLILALVSARVARAFAVT
jgi:4-hydroxybenzoate polyprenyltransferase